MDLGLWHWHSPNWPQSFMDKGVPLFLPPWPLQLESLEHNTWLPAAPEELACGHLPQPSSKEGWIFFSIQGWKDFSSQENNMVSVSRNWGISSFGAFLETFWFKSPGFRGRAEGLVFLPIPLCLREEQSQWTEGPTWTYRVLALWATEPLLPPNTMPPTTLDQNPHI